MSFYIFGLKLHNIHKSRAGGIYKNKLNHDENLHKATTILTPFTYIKKNCKGNDQNKFRQVSLNKQ